MPRVDYQVLYHRVLNASEDAIRLLQAAQQECEALYLDAQESEPIMHLLPLKNAKKDAP